MPAAAEHMSFTQPSGSSSMPVATQHASFLPAQSILSSSLPPLRDFRLPAATQHQLLSQPSSSSSASQLTAQFHESAIPSTLGSLLSFDAQLEELIRSLKSSAVCKLETEANPMDFKGYDCSKQYEKIIYFLDELVDSGNIDRQELPVVLDMSGGAEAYADMNNRQTGAGTGAKYRSPKGRGLTALHFAAQRDWLGVVKHLVERGANPLVRDGVGNTVMDIAMEAGSIDTARLLAGQFSGDTRQTRLAALWLLTRKKMPYIVRYNVQNFLKPATTKAGVPWNEFLESSGKVPRG